MCVCVLCTRRNLKRGGVGYSWAVSGHRIYEYTYIHTYVCVVVLNVSPCCLFHNLSMVNFALVLWYIRLLLSISISRSG